MLFAGGLAAGGPVTQAWLAAKILLFGGVVLNGIWIRSVLTHWPAAIEQARAGGDTAIKGEAAMKANQAVIAIRRMRTQVMERMEESDDGELRERLEELMEAASAVEAAPGPRGSRDRRPRCPQRGGHQAESGAGLRGGGQRHRGRTHPA